MTTLKFQRSSLLLSKLIMVQSKLDNQVYKEMIGQVLWSQLPSDRKNIRLEKQQKTLLIMRFMLPNFSIIEEGLVLGSITQNWAMRLGSKTLSSSSLSLARLKSK